MRTSFFDAVKVRKYFVLATVLCLFGFSFFCAENSLAPQWWREATVDDVKKRFVPLIYMSLPQAKRLKILQDAISYSQNEDCAKYILSLNQVLLEEWERKRLYEYALANPNMQDVAELIMLPLSYREEPEQELTNEDAAETKPAEEKIKKAK